MFIVKDNHYINLACVKNFCTGCSLAGAYWIRFDLVGEISPENRIHFEWKDENARTEALEQINSGLRNQIGITYLE